MNLICNLQNINYFPIEYKKPTTDIKNTNMKLILMNL